MGGECTYSRTCRPLWPVFIILATVSCMFTCSDSSAAVIGKMYPRGNHWAVGHLMGKKSLQGLNSDYLTPTETTMVTQMDRYQGLFEALMQHKNQQRQMVPKAADRRLRSGWREESTHVREMSDLLLKALKPQDHEST